MGHKSWLKFIFVVMSFILSSMALPSQVLATTSYTVTVAKTSHGTISPGTTKVIAGDNQTFTFTPDSGYVVGSVKVDGTLQTPVPSIYTFSDIAKDHTLSVTFVLSSYSITATTGANGSISPAGVTSVDYQGSQTYTITPDNGYQVDTLMVDGAKQTNATSYQFTDVTKNHTISVTFSVVTYNIKASVIGHGTITPSGTSKVAYNATKSFTITPDVGYQLTALSVDGAVVSGAPLTYTFYNVTSDHTIIATFEANINTIKATAGDNGSISPSGNVSVDLNASQTFTITPKSGYVVDTLKVDGKIQPNALTYTFNSVTEDHTISVTFTQSAHTITATAGANGTIAPSGKISVNTGNSQTFTITPSTGYQIDTLVIDGKKQAVAASYTFNNVTADQTISVTFSAIVPEIKASAGNHGSISPSGTVKVKYNASQAFTIKADKGYQIASITVDGSALTGTLPTSYIFQNVVSGHTINVTFIASTYTIKASAGANGSISPSGTITVDLNASQTFTITPDSGYAISTIKVDGKVQPNASTFTFPSVAANHTISVTFALSGYSIVATADMNGTISPSGTVAVVYGGSQTFTFTPNSGYQVGTITVNGVNKPISSSYTFTNVTSNQTISVTFTAVGNQSGSVYTITATAGANGSISPSGATTVVDNGSQTYTITPDAGYQIATVTVNGTVLQGTPSTYTFSNVTSNQTIGATFVVDPSIAINAFYTNAISNGYIANSNLLSIAVAQLNSLQQSDYSAYATALTLLVNDLTTLALDAITQYTTTPNNSNLQLAINDVTLLQPYNGVLLNGVGAYDNSVNLLAQAVTNVLAKNNDIQSLYSNDPRFQADNSFASDVAIDPSGNEYVSAPSNSSTGLGAIYEILKTSSQVLTITPVSPIEGDHFGRLFAVSGNTLVASSEPANGQAQVFIFTFQNNQWVQQTTLDLTTLANIAQIHQINLAFSGTSIAVGLPEYGEYLVFDQNTAANIPVNDIWQLDLTGNLTANNAPVAESISAEGGFIVIGAPVTTGSFVRILGQTAGDSTHIYNWSSTDIQSNNAGFGTSVSITGSTFVPTASKLTPLRLFSITQVAVGSPKENNGNGVVYIVTGSTSLSTKVTTWSAPQPVSMFTNSSTTLVGSEIAINNGMLLVGANPGIVMGYKLNTYNQWVWAFTDGPAQYVTNSLATNGILAIIGVQETSVANCSDYTGSGPCPISHVDSVQP